jgi:hypothetical protein
VVLGERQVGGSTGLAEDLPGDFFGSFIKDEDLVGAASEVERAVAGGDLVGGGSGQGEKEE